MDYQTYEQLYNAVYDKLAASLADDSLLSHESEGLYQALEIMRAAWVKADRERWGE